MEFTIQGVAAEVAERLGLEASPALVDAVRGVVPGRYENVDLDASDAILRAVWAAVEPDAAYPF